MDDNVTRWLKILEDLEKVAIAKAGSTIPLQGQTEVLTNENSTTDTL